jgi:ribosome biogenesis ATPase
MDDISLEKTDNKPVLVIGATNRPDSLDPALRRAGRFDREISMGVPDEEARAKILAKMCEKLRLEGAFDFRKLSKLTPGYVGADLSALTSEAGVIAVKRIFQSLSYSSQQEEQQDPGVNGVHGVQHQQRVTMDMDVDVEMGEADARPMLPATLDNNNNNNTLSDSSKQQQQQQELPPASNIISTFLSGRSTSLNPTELEPLCITEADFLLAITKVQPSSKREGFATVPDVTWSDVGALTNVREELRMSVVEPIRHPEHFARVGITKPMGVLLYGPPGCGKTLLAKAVANESCCNFISVKGPELLNKFVGESERGVRQVFARAAASKPCVIFFDELDALCPARSNDSENQSTSRLVNTLLTELDGMQSRSQVYIIAATNRPDMIDAAMLRPGRLDKTLYVDLPTALERFEILKTLTKKTPLRSDVDLKEIGTSEFCDGFSGADLAALVREAAVAALRESFLYRPGGVLGDSGGVVPTNSNSDTPPSTATSSKSMSASSSDGDASGKVAEDVWVTPAHFKVAFTRMAPSVSKRDRRKYELLKVKFSSGIGMTNEGPSTTNAKSDGKDGEGEK